MAVLIGIVISIFAFALMIFVHEFGHFITAKIFNVKVNKFALGMGPAIFKFGKHETEYSLRAFPIGGYCAMEGEDGESDDPRAFVNQKHWKKLIILVAGAFMNILLGLIIVSILVTQMNLLGTTYVYVREGYTDTLLMDGDKILEINGKNTYIATDVQYFLGLDNDGKVDMLVSRSGEEIELKDVKLETVTEDGVTGTVLPTDDIMIYGEEKSFIGVVKYAILSTVSTIRLIIYSFFSMITGKVPVSQLGGPVKVTETVVKSVSYGWETILNFIGMISINLGVFNLLPIPALDGGRVFFTIIDWISVSLFHKSINRKYEAMINSLFFVLLMALMLIIVFKDVFSLFF